jgi:hypothetical protein
VLFDRSRGRGSASTVSATLRRRSICLIEVEEVIEGEQGWL